MIQQRMRAVRSHSAARREWMCCKVLAAARMARAEKAWGSAFAAAEIFQHCLLGRREWMY